VLCGIEPGFRGRKTSDLVKRGETFGNNVSQTSYGLSVHDGFHGFPYQHRLAFLVRHGVSKGLSHVFGNAPGGGPHVGHDRVGIRFAAGADNPVESNEKTSHVHASAAIESYRAWSVFRCR